MRCIGTEWRPVAERLVAERSIADLRGNPAASPATPSPTAPAALPDPCVLVTEAQLTAAFGLDPGPGVSTTSGAVRVCTHGSGEDAVVVRIARVDLATFMAQATAIVGIRAVPGFDLGPRSEPDTARRRPLGAPVQLSG
jgi:hypothetical protein